LSLNLNDALAVIVEQKVNDAFAGLVNKKLRDYPLAARS
jgi:hypothetical protein